MNLTPKPKLTTGLLVGVLVTAPILVLFFLGDTLAGLPLPPLNLIDWMARNLPGNLLTTGIDAMVAAIRGLDLGRTDVYAKLAEQSMGVVIVMIVGVVGGGVAFVLLNRLNVNSHYLVGIIGGAILGGGFSALHLALPEAVAAPAANAPGTAVRLLWIMGVFALWGLGIAWVYSDLRRLPVANTSAENSAQQLDRRQFLVRIGGATATLTVIGAGLSLALRPPSSEPAVAVASADTPPLTGETPQATAEPIVNDGKLQPAPGTRPEYTPIEDHYRIDISSRPPVLDEATWVLPITGLVANPKEYTLADLRAFESMDMIVTMSCISNPLGGDLISTTRWTGVSLQKILDEIQPTPEGRYLMMRSADGFDEVLDLDLAREDETIMLCYAWDGAPLSVKHGFPLRIHIPNRYGMKQPKWITEMEVMATWEEGYWVRRGWSENAIVNTTSVIDTVAVEAVYEQDGVKYVPIGGIAWASKRSISKVEISIDNGEWVEAQLREPLSDRTWVIWRYDWAYEEGTHNFRVRAVDGEGRPQEEAERGVRPDGATGIHRRSAVV